MLVACHYDRSGAAIVDVTERLEKDGQYYMKAKNQGEETYILAVDKNVFNLIEVGTKYFISYKADKDRVGFSEND